MGINDNVLSLKDVVFWICRCRFYSSAVDPAVWLPAHSCRPTCRSQ
ncbi:hypothetical protein CAter282_1056 [Collimonas arenae]|uniref:Uncharacterized protein n=1 Tax=Collimonas arenae TaxID=279058 RepID=A0A127QFN0_9BURK|nr:hypothetical protein CAter10_1143 [Collimonas arenae]AMP08851.1 hypothetical protein CAter282_1056 [Collimonas arenae]